MTVDDDEMRQPRLRRKDHRVPLILREQRMFNSSSHPEEALGVNLGR